MFRPYLKRSLPGDISVAVLVIDGATSDIFCTGKSLSEVLLFAQDGENMLCTKIVLNVRNNFCTPHALPRFELGNCMY